MRSGDYFRFAISSLRKRKLRTALTVFGVTIGIGALAAMLAFGKGIQKNITDRFLSLELFNSLTVFAEAPDWMSRGRPAVLRPSDTARVLDDDAVGRIQSLPGVLFAFPEVRFPAAVEYEGREELRLVQVLPARAAASKMISLRAGNPYASDDEPSLIISRSLLRQLGAEDPDKSVGRPIALSSVSLDLSGFNPMDPAALLSSGRLPFSRERYELVIAGVADDLQLGGPNPMRSEVYLPPGSADRMKKLPFTNVWDIFRAGGPGRGYAALNVRVSSSRAIEPLKRDIEKMGFTVFALLDQFREIRTGFLIIDMLLFAVGMIAIVVASLGIINTMVMSILERTAEIGIMKAVGARDGDIKRIFFFESGTIGLLGGLSGLALGWVVSRLINQVINYFLAKQGIPFVDYFYFPLWISAGAVAFSVLVSLVSGIYPAARAARVDPVVALRHN